MSAAPAPSSPSSAPEPAQSTPVKDKFAQATVAKDAPSTPTQKQTVESENVPPTPEVRLNGRRTSTSSVTATPSRDGPGGGDGWGSNFWVTLVDPQTQVSFFACPATGEVSWDPPAGHFLLPPSPEGEWWEMFDEASGLPYYYQTKTGETVWERPNAFVIPLGVLQNTALTRRLSLVNRGPQQPRTSFDTRNGSHPTSGTPTSERSPYRRSRSYVNDREGGFANGHGHGTKGTGSPTQARRSHSSTRSSPGRTQAAHAGSNQSSRPGSSGRRSVQSPRKSTSSAEHLHHSSGSQGGPLAYERGHPLAPIPGSPYNTDAAPSPAPSTDGRPSTSGTPVNGRPASKRDNLRESDEPNTARSRAKSSSYMQYRAPQPQSLTAALEMIALSSSQSSSAPSSQDKQGGSEHGHGSRSVPITPLHESPRKMKINTDPKLLSGASLSDGMSTPDTPLRFKFKGLGKDKGSMPPSPTRPQLVAPQPRRSVSSPVPVQIRGKEIGNPVLNPEASRHMSQLVDRNGSTPIPVNIYDKTARTSSLNTGKYLVLPHDLASDIQQFAESEFAKQYFSTHRTGFIFKRTVPVSEIMTWQKAPITSPLLHMKRELHKDAVKTFRVIQRIMGDRERDRPGGVSPISPLASTVSVASGMSKSLLEEERWLLSVGLSYGELRDEIYCQVMKQLNGNPNTESVFRGWQLLCVLLVTFPPSKNFEAYLRSYIQQATTQQEGRVDVMAKYCLRRLAYISKKGPRGKPPSAAEIETASDAAFHPSIFGEALDTVYRLQERNYPDKKVPIILPFLADGILALGGTKSEGIFRIPGDGDLVSDLKLRIDKGYYSLDTIDDPHVLASLLKLWLRELIDPLVPDELYNDCITKSHDPDACVQIVQRLPTINRRVVLFVISFLQLFLEDKVQVVTKMTSANLALVMAPNLLRCNSESMAVVYTNSAYEQRFVHSLLLHLKCDQVDPDFVPVHGHGAISATPSAPRRSTNKRTNRPNH
ncbi:hypothetical protein DICSQDRAFT_157170 [Dichomitus squalens LYAD-421 SS1]|uniref:Rho GTPase activation protein n=1 Tax=Dichomitus squalens (strain LYAD-421) TaxID=732165 RepID=R7SNI7_DICSQ|nr:uncharacterized protein DICSQDRAFT_157170 [Dichomitus squalens LYAD-421 SS1]EJF57744.1 hypothetical protein DICSQDRAFT_157170 [Dichomitus squalens LYAD-421 SS1]